MSKISTLNQLKRINTLLEGNVVFVGGVAEYLRGSKDTIKDIDMIVTVNPKNLNEFNLVHIYNNRTRAFVTSTPNTLTLDMFIRKNFNFLEYTEYEGVKLQTFENLLNYHRNFSQASGISESARKKSMETITRLENFLNNT